MTGGCQIPRDNQPRGPCGDSRSLTPSVTQHTGILFRRYATHCPDQPKTPARIYSFERKRKQAQFSPFRHSRNVPDESKQIVREPSVGVSDRRRKRHSAKLRRSGRTARADDMSFVPDIGKTLRSIQYPTMLETDVLQHRPSLVTISFRLNDLTRISDE